MKKNILIIAYAYPPNNAAGGQRPYALAKYLNKEKYNIKVITCENPDLSIGDNLQFEPNINGVDLIPIKSYMGNSISNLRSSMGVSKKKNNVIVALKSFLFRIGQNFIFPDKGILWYPIVKKYLKQNPNLVNSTDIIFSTSPGITNHQIARYLKRRNKKIHWLADFRDFNYVNNWDHRKGVKSLLHKKLEKSIIVESTALTFVTKTMLNAYQDFYPEMRYKMHCVYNGFDWSERSSLSEASLGTKEIRIFYAGSFYKGLRSPLPLLALLDRAFEEKLLIPDVVQIEIAGNVDIELLSEIKNYKSYSCIKLLGNLPRAAVLTRMTRATFLWLIVANIKSHYQTIPIKLFEYIAARRPIINFAPAISESSDIIDENKLGYNINTLNFKMEESYSKFERIIREFNNGDFNNPLSHQNLDSFTWINQIGKIEGIL